jgi:hypothetical protein
MAVLSKLKFWGKKDEFDVDDLAEREARGKHEDLALTPKLGLEEKSLFPDDHTPDLNLQPRMAPSPLHEKDLELISSKLDTIKAMLVSIEQRLSQVEQAVGMEKKQRLW